MPDPSSPKRPLSEIGHLFLSDIRDAATGGAARPQRVGPRHSAGGASRQQSMDLTPVEYVHGSGTIPAPEEAPTPVPPVIAVLAAHLGQDQTASDRVTRYARHLAARIGRVGLIEMNASLFRLTCFDPSAQSTAPQSDIESSNESFAGHHARRIAEAIEEMNWDVRQWLLLADDPRTPEVRALLRQAGRWVLLSTCDHDGVVASYRLLKGLSEGHRPPLSLAVLNAADAAQATQVFQKMQNVCAQFLQWPLNAEPAVETVQDVAKHLVLQCHTTHDKAQLADHSQWKVVEELLGRAALSAAEPVAPVAASAHSAPAAAIQSPAIMASAPVQAEPTPAMAEHFSEQAMPHPISMTEVLDLPGPIGSPQTILDAVLRQEGSDLAECSLRAPMCADARIAIGRDHGLVLVAVARQGLTDLRGIGLAYRWLIENRALIAMAIPQFTIDINHAPRLRLLVDQIDLSAGILRPLLQSDQITVQPYRTLRWGGKTGLLLEAA